MARSSLLVLQSGGPTAVINATLAGVLEGAREQGFGRVLGALRGFSGLLEGHLVDLTALSGDRLERLARTPGAALGTSRERVDARSAPQALRILDQLRIETAIVIGGNDTAANAQALLTAATEAGQPLTVIHAPKTIDNDLPETDHTPGYPSAARFLAQATHDILIDSWSVRDLYPITLLEVQGRNAGWLAAACAVAAPASLRDHLLLFFPERPPESPASLIDELLEARQAR
ncbi:MAG: 6-phosphofructokinase, partial [Thermomicrobium sp.]|nr:6-phosphofructokinase [Thermomicrobium sp.]